MHRGPVDLGESFGKVNGTGHMIVVISPVPENTSFMCLVLFSCTRSSIWKFGGCHPSAVLLPISESRNIEPLLTDRKR